MKKVKSFNTRTWVVTNRYFVASIILFIASIVTLLIAVRVASERMHVPYTGIAINQPVTSGSSTLTVVGAERKPGRQPFVAPTGYEYLIISLRVRNNGEKPFSVLPTADTYVKTAEGKVSYLTPYALTYPYRSGLILPGDSTEGELSYLVPMHETYKFYVESDWSSTAVPFMVQSNNNKR